MVSDTNSHIYTHNFAVYKKTGVKICEKKIINEKYFCSLSLEGI